MGPHSKLKQYKETAEHSMKSFMQKHQMQNIQNKSHGLFGDFLFTSMFAPAFKHMLFTISVYLYSNHFGIF